MTVQPERHQIHTDLARQVEELAAAPLSNWTDADAEEPMEVHAIRYVISPAARGGTNSATVLEAQLMIAGGGTAAAW